MSDKENKKREEGKGEGFSLPGDYFEASAMRIRNRIEWEDEHAPWALLRQHRATGHFLVPDNYFDSLSELAEFPSLLMLRKKRAFEVPDEYFKHQSAGISTALTGPDTITQEPFKGLPKENPFLVADNYFENSATAITERLLPTRNARVIRLFPARIAWAAAALLLIASGFLLYNSYFLAEEKDCGTIACIDKAELIKAASNEILEDEELYEMIDLEDLEHTLENKSREKRPRAADSTGKDLSNDI